MKPEIISIECKTISDAEHEYLKRMEEGCWQVVRPLKIVWSWKSFSYVARFSMKRVEKVYTIQQNMKDINKMIDCGVQTALLINTAVNSRRKAKEAFEKLLKQNP